MSTGAGSRPRLILSVLSGHFAICRLASGAAPPDWAFMGPFFSITATAEELSVVCPEENVPEGVLAEKGWRCFHVHGPFSFNLTGILNALTAPLAEAQVGIFALSTYNTDYLLVKSGDL